MGSINLKIKISFVLSTFFLIFHNLWIWRALLAPRHTANCSFLTGFASWLEPVDGVIFSALQVKMRWVQALLFITSMVCGADFSSNKYPFIWKSKQIKKGDTWERGGVHFWLMSENIEVFFKASLLSKIKSAIVWLYLCSMCETAAIKCKQRRSKIH